MLIFFTEEPQFVRPMKSEKKTVGSTTVLECITSGSPKPEIVWLKDGAPFEVTPRHFLAANKQLLIIMRTEMSDAGMYSCQVAWLVILIFKCHSLYI